MADFTVEGIITIDSSRGIRNLTRFQTKLKSVVADIKKTSREIDKLDGRKIRISVDVSKTEIDELKADLKTIRDEKVKIKTESSGVGETLTEMEALEAELKAMDHTDVDVKVTMAGAAKTIAQATKLNAELDAVLNQKRKIKINFSALNALRVKALQAASSINAPGFSLVSAIAAIAPALIPVGAVATGVLGGMIGSFATLTAGVGAFAVFAIPTIKDVAKAVKLLNTDTTKLSKTDLKKFNKQVADLKKSHPVIYQIGKDFIALKKDYLEVAKAIRPDVIDAINVSLRVAHYLIGQIGGIAKKVAPDITQLFRDMNKGLRTKDWTAFFRYVRTNTGFFIRTWGRAVGNFITGIANMVRAFDPLSKWFSRGLLGYSRQFRKWTSGLANDPGFQAFVKYVKKSGPEVAHFIGQVVHVFIELSKALAPVGDKVLGVINQLLDLYSAFRKSNPKLADFLTKAGLVALVLAPFADFLISIVGAVAGLLGPWGIFIAAVAVLTGLFASLNKNTKKYTPMVKELKRLWKDLKSNASDLVDYVKQLWDLFKQSGAIEQYQEAVRNFARVLRRLMPVFKFFAGATATAVFGFFIVLGYTLNAFSRLLLSIVNSVSHFVKKVVGFFKWLYNVLVGHSIIPDLINGIHRWFMKLVNFVMNPVRAIRRGVVAAWNYIRGRTIAVFGAVAGFVRNKLSAIRSFVSGGVSKVKGIFSSGWSAISSGTSRAYTNIVGSIKNKLSDAKATAARLWKDMKSNAASMLHDIVTSVGSILSGIKGKITGAFSGAAGWLIGAGESILRGLGQGISAGISKYLTGPLNSVGGFIKSHLPGSPVKRGPLRVLNHGRVGAKIVKMIAGGIRQEKRSLRRAMEDTLSVAKTNLPKRVGTGSSMNAINKSTPVQMPGRGVRIQKTYKIEVTAELGSNPAEIGKKIVDAINAYEETGGSGFVTVGMPA